MLAAKKELHLQENIFSRRKQKNKNPLRELEEEEEEGEEEEVGGEEFSGEAQGRRRGTRAEAHPPWCRSQR